MLKTGPGGIHPDPAAQSHLQESDPFDLRWLTGAVRRQRGIVLLFSLAGLALGVVYLLTATPLYTATTSVLVDRRQGGIADELTMQTGILQDEADMLSQVELLKSERIRRAVAARLALASDAAFTGAVAPSAMEYVASFGSFILNLTGLVEMNAPVVIPSEAEKTQAVLAVLRNGVSVERAGRTYILDVRYTSADPVQAARIANAFAEAYIDDQLEAKYEATRRASAWLQDRIAELRQLSIDSDLAVQRFRNEHGLIATGDGLVTEQQMSEISSQLIASQGETARTKARFERIQSLIASGDVQAVVVDALDSSIINRLREQYMAASKAEAEIARALGPAHLQAANLRGEMEEYERLIFSELGRIAESYRSEFEVAQSREQTLRDSLSESLTLAASTNETQVQLRELERTAESYDGLYQTFLQRYQETVQQQSFPITEARVISTATPPAIPSAPRKTMVLATGLLLGALFGFGIATWREVRERTYRTGSDLQTDTGIPLLGMIPQVSVSRRGRQATLGKYVISNPFSPMAEVLRGAQVVVDGLVTCKVIGVISALPGEGKSTIAVNMARQLAKQGARTILVDGDIRNPTLNSFFADQKAEAGLLDVAGDDADYRTAVFVDTETGLSVLPGAPGNRADDQIAALPGIRALIKRLRDDFDYVIVDLPPIVPVADARGFAPSVDGFVLVVEWGRTPRELVQSAMGFQPEVRERIIGALLNKVQFKQLRYYTGYAAEHRYYGGYPAYGGASANQG